MRLSPLFFIITGPLWWEETYAFVKDTYYFDICNENLGSKLNHRDRYLDYRVRIADMYLFDGDDGCGEGMGDVVSAEYGKNEVCWSEHTATKVC